ncbi:MAG: immune inhibitor A, partial [Firmicutes bacterium]|nr:immune inhibitor A [Bacillota bacterium]
MKKLIWISLLLSLILVAVPLFSASAQDKLPPPIDPQSWVLNRDLTWENYYPNPVIDWMTELNPAGLAAPSGLNNPNYPGTNRRIRGGLIMIEYLDRKFISRQPQNSDPTGFYMYRADGPVKLADGTVTGREDEITRNPIVSGSLIVAAAKKYNKDYLTYDFTESELKSITDAEMAAVTDGEFSQWWADYLNKPQTINNYATIDEYWRENTYGKWAMDVIPYGPFTIPYFEFETMGYDMSSSFQTYRDVPPSFRSGASGTSNSSTFDSIAIPFARTSGVPFAQLDFFFMLHAGYDESGVWQQLGMAQFSSRKDIPYELGPGPRMTQVEEFFTKNPSYLTTYASRYANNTSRPGGTSQPTVAQFWSGERDRYAAMVTAGTAGQYEFKLPQWDWDWVAGYNDQTQRNTRYVAFTCWAAAVGEWSHMSSAATSLTGAGRTLRYSTQGENDGMGTFAHEFGHIGELPDNYQLQWTINNSPLTEPWEIMSRGQLNGPYDYHTRWQVPNVQGGTIPTNMTMRNKIVLKSFDAATNNPSNTISANGAKGNDILEVRVQDLAASTPVVAEVVARNIPLNNKGYYPQLDQYGLFSPNYYKGIHLTFATGSTSAYRDRATRVQTGWTWTYTAQATWMGVEVVGMTGYDSFAPDHGVILTRMANESAGTGTSYTWNVIDSHLYDIAMVDYMVPGQNGAADDYVAHALGSPYQLWDASFHAGKSFVDTGYYRTKYDPADPHYNDAQTRQLNSSNYDLQWKKGMLIPGSQQRWEDPNGREIASGDTVNEWHDPYNDLHFYILAYNEHDGRTLPGKTTPEQFISYTIGVRHGAGTAVGGELDVAVAEVEREKPLKVAVANFNITNTGNATDIIRLGVTGYLDPLLLNDLYAVGAGETITVPIYVELPGDIRTKDLSGKTITLSASSETNGGKIGSATIAASDLIAYNYNVYLVPDQSAIYAGETVNVDLMLSGDINYTQISAEIAYDTNLLKYEGYTNLAGIVAAVSPLNGKVSVRSVPSLNMVSGEPCAPEVKIVTLKFTALSNFSEDKTTTALGFASTFVNPPAGSIGAGTAPGEELPLIIYDTIFTKHFNKNIELYPEWIGVDAQGLPTTMPIFNYNSAGSYIKEEVWVEVPC